MSGTSSYMPDYDISQDTRDIARPLFHHESVIDQQASDKAGYRVYAQEERVRIIFPGVRENEFVGLVTDEHRRRWPRQYEAFIKGTTMAVTGTPIEAWAFVTPAMCKMLKGMDIHTIEECAALPDNVINRFMGGRALKNMALAYFDEQAGDAALVAAIARADKAEVVATETQKEVAELRRLLDKMHGQLTQIQSAPSAAAMYIPAEHDPVALRAQAAPPHVSAASALDEIREIPARRGPGRPPKQQPEGAAA